MVDTVHFFLYTPWIWNIVSPKKRKNNQEHGKYMRRMFYFVVMEKYGLPLILSRKKKRKTINRKFLIVDH